MQTGNIVSLHAASDAEIAPFTRVKMTSTGVAVAGAADTAIGSTLPGDLNRNYPTVQLFGDYVEAMLGADAAVVAGDEVEAAASGKVIKKNTGDAIGVAITGGTLTNDRIDVVIY